MAIKDKDGNVYKLRGPNPLVKNLSEWDSNSVIVINRYGVKEIVSDLNNPIKEQQEYVKDISKELNLYEGTEETKNVSAQEFLDEVAQKEEPPKVEMPIENIVDKQPSQTESITIEVNEKTAKILKERGCAFHCAPVIGQKLWKDELYGTSYTTNKYGTKFIFDAVIVAQSDLEMQFWCIREIKKDSIVLKIDQQGGERCWRIHEIESKSGGYLCRAMISDTNPDFS